MVQNDAHLLCHLDLCPDERRHLESGTFRRLCVGRVAREGCEPGSLVRLLVEFLDERFRRRCELLRAQEREEVDVRFCFRKSSARPVKLPVRGKETHAEFLLPSLRLHKRV